MTQLVGNILFVQWKRLSSDSISDNKSLLCEIMFSNYDFLVFGETVSTVETVYVDIKSETNLM